MTETARETRPPLPKVLCTSVIRSSRPGDSHGGVYLVDLETGVHECKVDWNDGSIDWAGRGGDRGLRGIAFHGDEIYIAASDEIFVYDRDFRVKRSIRNRYLGLCHEIKIVDDQLYVTATAYDSVLVYELAKHRFVAGYCIRNPRRERPTPESLRNAKLSFGAFDPETDKGPPPGDTTHINSVWAERGVIYVCGLKFPHMIAIARDGPGAYARVPPFTHNARPFRGGVLANATAEEIIGWFGRDGQRLRAFGIPRFPLQALEHADLPQDYARQAFGRGLCVREAPEAAGPDELLIGGSSPASVTAYRLDSGEILRTVTLTMDVRNAVHGLEIWPYG
jgi:hypothetical protein